MKKTKIVKSGVRFAKKSKYYHVVKPLLDKHGISVRKWAEYGADCVYFADFETHAAYLPIPDCEWSCYICLHEIGHLVKGSRMYSYLQEYHAETYALERVQSMNLKGASAMVKNGKAYVLNNILQDIIFNNLSPNSVRKEVREWLNTTPKQLKTQALRRCTYIIKKLLVEHPVMPFTQIDKQEIDVVKERREQILQIKISS